MLYETVEFWVLSTIILVLLAVVGYFYQRSKAAEDATRKAEESAIMVVVGGIKESVDNLVESIKEHTAENTRLFEKGDERFNKLERRLDVVETKCDMHHGSGAEDV